MKEIIIILLFIIPRFGNLPNTTFSLNNIRKATSFITSKSNAKQLVTLENQLTDELFQNNTEFESSGVKRTIPFSRNKNTGIHFELISKVQSTIFPLFYDLPPPDFTLREMFFVPARLIFGAGLNTFSC